MSIFCTLDLLYKGIYLYKVSIFSIYHFIEDDSILLDQQTSSRYVDSKHDASSLCTAATLNEQKATQTPPRMLSSLSSLAESTMSSEKTASKLLLVSEERKQKPTTVTKSDRHEM